MEEEQVNSKKKIILISSITIITLILVVGISYALWQQSKVQEGTNYIASGCFGVEFVGNNPINLANSFPITTEDGMKTTPYTFTITNTCNGKAAYDVNLESLSNTTFQNTSIRVALDETNKLYSEYEEAEPYYETSVESRKLISGRLEASESITYNLRLWIDEAVTIEEQNKIFASKIVVNASEDFDDPLIENINATSTINSINITYNANGDISTTCKYGLTEGTYDNTVEDATTSECNITGLSDNTTYYYQICTETGRGIKCEEGNINTKKKTIADIVKVGDYVSMTPTATSYIPPRSVTGTDLNLTINPSELNLWRVIKKNNDGTVEMVSDKVSSKNVDFYGEEGYINLVGGLNTIAAQYTNSKYVQSTRHIGYSTQTKTITNTKYVMQTTRPFPLSTSPKSTWTWVGDLSGSYMLEMNENKGGGDVSYFTDYRLVNNVYGNMMGKTPNGTSAAYWLASRYYEAIRESDWLFYGRCVETTGELDAGALRGYNRSSFAVRPIVIIKADVQIISGDGQSISTAYRFEK